MFAQIARRINVLFLPLMIMGWLFGIFFITKEQFQSEASSAPDKYKGESYFFSHLTTKQLNILILNKKNIFDDLTQIWLLQQIVENKPLQDPQHYRTKIHSALKHSPQIETIYLISCVVMFKDLKSPEHCQEITIAGMKVFPKSWRLPMLQGYVHAFLLDQPGLAASFYGYAASLKNSPPYVKRITKKLALKEGITPEDAQENLTLLFPDSDKLRIRSLFNSQP